MADSYAKLGLAGVMLTDQEYTPTDGSVESAQNAEVVLDAEQGGDPSLGKRGGYLPLGDAFVDDVVELVEIRFIADLASL